MAASIASLNIDVTARTAAFVKGMRQCISESESFTKKLGDVAGISFSPLDMAADAFQMVKESIADSLEEIDQIGKLSDRLGIATEELIAFQHAAELSGPGAEGFNKAIEQMSKRLGEIRLGSGKEAARALQSLKLDPKEIAGANPGVAFEQIAEAISKIKSPTDQAAVAFALFGRQGIEILNMLQEGKEGLDAARSEVERLNLTFSRMDATAVEEANDAITTLKASMKGLSNQAAIELAPTIKMLADAAPTLAKIAQLTIHQPSAVQAGVGFVTPKEKATPGTAAPAGSTGPAPGELAAIAEAAQKESERLAKEAEKLTESLRTPLEKFRDEEQKLIDLRNRELISTETMNRGIAAAQEELRKSVPLWDEAKKLWEETKTPLEKFNNELLAFQVMLDSGAINADVYSRAIAAATEEYRKADPALKALADSTEEMARSAEELEKKVRTPMEAFTAEFDRLLKLWNAGLDEELFLKGLDKAAEELAKELIPEVQSPSAVEAGSASAVSLMAKMESDAARAEEIRDRKEALKHEAAAARGISDLNSLIRDGLVREARL